MTFRLATRLLTRVRPCAIRCLHTPRQTPLTRTSLPRPSTSSRQQSWHPRTPFLGVRTMFIQTEPTPNPDALKFIPGTQVLPEGASSMEYIDGRDTHNSPLARKLFTVDGVRSVFYGPDFITVVKDSESNWAYLKPEVFSLITEALNSGGSVVTEGTEVAQDTMVREGDSEVVGMIKELLDTRIRPAIQEDGGDIEYRGFENGQVLLKLRGACRTCDSSTVTLRNGIESMLMHYVEEVKGVTQILDQEEEIAIQEFEKFEQKLKNLKGPAAIASTGKGGLDTAEAVPIGDALGGFGAFTDIRIRKS